VKPIDGDDTSEEEGGGDDKVNHTVLRTAYFVIRSTD
jgi:hypothetical protein